MPDMRQCQRFHISDGDSVAELILNRVDVLDAKSADTHFQTLVKYEKGRSLKGEARIS